MIIFLEWEEKLWQLSSLLKDDTTFKNSKCGWKILPALSANKVKSLSHVQLFVTPGTIQSMEFSRLEYWSGWSSPSPGDLPNPGIEPRSPALQVDSLPAELGGNPKGHYNQQACSHCACVRACMHAHARAQSCLTLCKPIDCSPSSSYIYGISQARILEWVAIPFSRGSAWPRNRSHISCVSCIGRQVLSQLSHPGSSHCSYPQLCTLRGFSMEKKQGAGPSRLRCTSQEWFQWAQTLALSYTEKW